MDKKLIFVLINQFVNTLVIHLKFLTLLINLYASSNRYTIFLKM